MIKANIMPIFNSDMKILLKLCSFLRFFDVLISKIRAVKKNHVHTYLQCLWIGFGTKYSHTCFNILITGRQMAHCKMTVLCKYYCYYVNGTFFSWKILCWKFSVVLKLTSVIFAFLCNRSFSSFLLLYIDTF